MSANLTPTEALLMGELAARVRTGESVWTFANMHLRTLRSLQTKGMLQFDSAPVANHQLAWLTDAGRAEYLKEGYTRPVERLREQIVEQEAYIDGLTGARRAIAEKATRVETENRRLRRQLRVAVGHLGGVSAAEDLDAALRAPAVLVLHQDGSTTTGRLKLLEDGSGYACDPGTGPVPIQPVGDYAGEWSHPSVDIVRPVTG